MFPAMLKPPKPPSQPDKRTVTGERRNGIDNHFLHCLVIPEIACTVEMAARPFDGVNYA